ncbi:MAG: hypothetical protein FWC50_11210 [Planctomycetaceae bacterium]|nr:hypothetical protein [Planctomycetaceae bacterium]
MSEINNENWLSARKIDPLLLDLFREKTQKEKSERHGNAVPVAKERSLGVCYSAYMGITAMVLSIFLGTLKGDDQETILSHACLWLLVYIVIGFVAGKIAEFCVQESAKSLLQETLSRVESYQQAEENTLSDHETSE